MLDNSVIFPKHEINQVNTSLPLRFGGHGAQDTATFERARDILANKVYCKCEIGYGYFMPDGSCVVCTNCGKEIQLENRHLQPELAVVEQKRVSAASEAMAAGGGR